MPTNILTNRNSFLDKYCTDKKICNKTIRELIKEIYDKNPIFWKNNTDYAKIKYVRKKMRKSTYMPHHRQTEDLPTHDERSAKEAADAAAAAAAAAAVADPTPAVADPTPAVADPVATDPTPAWYTRPTWLEQYFDVTDPTKIWQRLSVPALATRAYNKAIRRVSAGDYNAFAGPETDPWETERPDLWTGPPEWVSNRRINMSESQIDYWWQQVQDQKVLWETEDRTLVDGVVAPVEGRVGGNP